MRDKDYSGCLGLLSKELHPKIYVTAIPEMTRAAKPDDLLTAAKGVCILFGISGEKQRPESSTSRQILPNGL
ncbi:MAG: hypothetical protein IJP54_04670 [Synergistaceae bacterium]|nr:hypothetical protein [Synergistaceae bacterium]MBR0034947.1 hypothetical protein [Synergistaceae bacterium]